ncbi:hypothetical protein AAVH_14374 [Aphelenchoides avenae]|nr:hypothetical protein AAVH_14374 [Aphelenchus avenae]
MELLTPANASSRSKAMASVLLLAAMIACVLLVSAVYLSSYRTNLVIALAPCAVVLLLLYFLYRRIDVLLADQQGLIDCESLSNVTTTSECNGKNPSPAHSTLCSTDSTLAIIPLDLVN